MARWDGVCRAMLLMCLMVLVGAAISRQELGRQAGMGMWNDLPLTSLPDLLLLSTRTASPGILAGAYQQLGDGFCELALPSAEVLSYASVLVPTLRLLVRLVDMRRISLVRLSTAPILLSSIRFWVASGGVPTTAPASVAGLLGRRPAAANLRIAIAGCHDCVDTC
jgi:hypothetical protein